MQEGSNDRSGEARSRSLPRGSIGTRTAILVLAAALLVAGSWVALLHAALRASTTNALLLAKTVATTGVPTRDVGRPKQAAPSTNDPILVGAGDIADCTDNSGAAATANLIKGIGPGAAVFTLGDNAYDKGSPEQFQKCYGPTWGQFKDRTHPSPGNHDYETKGAAGYFGYFGAAAGPVDKGYYSYDVGKWHVVSLNSNCDRIGGCSKDSPEVRWLKQDLATHETTCTLAYWHAPRFSSGYHGDSADVKPLWDALYASGADVVLNGHDHDYERFAPQDPSGKADPGAGIREFVAGTGGKERRPFQAAKPNSQVRIADTGGVLALKLHPTSYQWSFVTAPNGKVADSGSASCRAPGSPIGANITPAGQNGDPHGPPLTAPQTQPPAPAPTGSNTDATTFGAPGGSTGATLMSTTAPMGDGFTTRATTSAASTARPPTTAPAGVPTTGSTTGAITGATTGSTTDETTESTATQPPATTEPGKPAPAPATTPTTDTTTAETISPTTASTVQPTTAPWTAAATTTDTAPVPAPATTSPSTNSMTMPRTSPATMNSTTAVTNNTTTTASATAPSQPASTATTSMAQEGPRPAPPSATPAPSPSKEAPKAEPAPPPEPASAAPAPPERVSPPPPPLPQTSPPLPSQPTSAGPVPILPDTGGAAGPLLLCVSLVAGGVLILGRWALLRHQPEPSSESSARGESGWEDEDEE